MENLVSGFEQITGVSLHVLFLICFVISLEVLGLVQFIKNFVRCDSKKCKHINENGHYCVNCIKWKWAGISILMCLICSIMNTTLVPPIMTRIFDFFTLSLAMVQMCHDVIVKSLPKALGSIINRSIGVEDKEN